MALKAATEKLTEAKPQSPVAQQTTVLELALYKIYTWGGVTYEKGKPYRFKNSDAMVLLAEQDTGRPVWRLYRPEKPKQAPKNEIVDATNIKAPTPLDEFGTPLSVAALEQKRIDVGDDSEIADIIGKEDSSGDVTV